MNYVNDNRIVMTLDAGGTNFVFSAIQGNQQKVDEIRLDSEADNLENSLANIIEGFSRIKKSLSSKPVAISFAFPGPADYPNGVLGDLGNFPAYRGGVPLGPILEEKFKLPVYINNDGDLFAYGESIAGFLPHINEKLESAGNPKRYKNLMGVTLGTGFGSGIVHNDELFLGDNSIAGEIFLLRSKLIPFENVEESASIRGVQRVYCNESGAENDSVPSPKEIYDIAIGEKDGNQEAAKEAFNHVGQVVGDAISSAVTLLDCLVVVGGGLSGANSLLMPSIINEMNSYYELPNGSKQKRLLANVYNIDDENDLHKFLENSSETMLLNGTNKIVRFDLTKKIGVGTTRIGTSKAIAIGAYNFALHQLDKKIV